METTYYQLIVDGLQIALLASIAVSNIMKT